MTTSGNPIVSTHEQYEFSRGMEQRSPATYPFLGLGDTNCYGLLSDSAKRAISKDRIINTTTIYDKNANRDNLQDSDKNSFMVGGILDPRLGTIEPGTKCITCGEKYGICPGHPGRIELALPMLIYDGASGPYFQTLQKAVSAICPLCCTLLKMGTCLSCKTKYSKIEAEPSRKKNEDGVGKSGKAGSRIKLTGFRMVSVNKTGHQKTISLYGVTIRRIFEIIEDKMINNDINPSDVKKKMGIQFPTLLVPRTLLVLPPIHRPNPPKEQNGELSLGDSTRAYLEVIAENNSLWRSVLSEHKNIYVRPAELLAKDKLSGAFQSIILTGDVIGDHDFLTKFYPGFQYEGANLSKEGVQIYLNSVIEETSQIMLNSKAKDEDVSKLLDNLGNLSKKLNELMNGQDKFNAFNEFEEKTFMGLWDIITGDKSGGGKYGIARSTILGKRTDHVARAIILGDNNIPHDCCGVPSWFMRKLTTEDGVLKTNVDEILSELRSPTDRDGRYVSIRITGGNRGKNKWVFSELDDEGRLEAENAVNRFIRGKLKGFMYARRHLRKGDKAMVNRQPTLQRQNLQCLTILPVEGNTILMNPEQSAAYNLDFDGDQMNIFIPQNAMAKAELQVLHDPSLLMADANGNNVLAPGPNTVLGLYILTTKIPESDFDNHIDVFRRLSNTFLEKDVAILKGSDYRIDRGPWVTSAYTDTWRSNSIVAIESLIEKGTSKRDAVLGELLRACLPHGFNVTLKGGLRVSPQEITMAGNFTKGSLKQLYYHILHFGGGKVLLASMGCFQRLGQATLATLDACASSPWDFEAAVKFHDEEGSASELRHKIEDFAATPVSEDSLAEAGTKLKKLVESLKGVTGEGFDTKMTNLVSGAMADTVMSGTKGNTEALLKMGVAIGVLKAANVGGKKVQKEMLPLPTAPSMKRLSDVGFAKDCYLTGMRDMAAFFDSQSLGVYSELEVKEDVGSVGYNTRKALLAAFPVIINTLGECVQTGGEGYKRIIQSIYGGDGLDPHKLQVMENISGEICEECYNLAEWGKWEHGIPCRCKDHKHREDTEFSTMKYPVNLGMAAKMALDWRFSTPEDVASWLSITFPLVLHSVANVEEGDIISRFKILQSVQSVMEDKELPISANVFVKALLPHVFGRIPPGDMFFEKMIKQCRHIVDVKGMSFVVALAFTEIVLNRVEYCRAEYGAPVGGFAVENFMAGLSQAALDAKHGSSASAKDRLSELTDLPQPTEVVLGFGKNEDSPLVRILGSRTYGDNIKKIRKFYVVGRPGEGTNPENWRPDLLHIPETDDGNIPYMARGFGMEVEMLDSGSAEHLVEKLTKDMYFKTSVKNDIFIENNDRRVVMICTSPEPLLFIVLRDVYLEYMNLQKSSGGMDDKAITKAAALSLRKIGSFTNSQIKRYACAIVGIVTGHILKSSGRSKVPIPEDQWYTALQMVLLDSDEASPSSMKADSVMLFDALTINDFIRQKPKDYKADWKEILRIHKNYDVEQLDGPVYTNIQNIHNNRINLPDDMGVKVLKRIPVAKSDFKDKSEMKKTVGTETKNFLLLQKSKQQSFKVTFTTNYPTFKTRTNRLVAEELRDVPLYIGSENTRLGKCTDIVTKKINEVLKTSFEGVPNSKLMESPRMLHISMEVDNKSESLSKPSNTLKESIKRQEGNSIKSGILLSARLIQQHGKTNYNPDTDKDLMKWLKTNDFSKSISGENTATSVVSSIETTNPVAAQVAFGIEGGREVLYTALRQLFVKSDPRHASIVADLLTMDGTLRGIRRGDVADTRTPLELMAYEGIKQSLGDAAIKGECVEEVSVIVQTLMNQPAYIGTGVIDVDTRDQRSCKGFTMGLVTKIDADEEEPPSVVSTNTEQPPPRGGERSTERPLRKRKYLEIEDKPFTEFPSTSTLNL